MTVGFHISINFFNYVIVAGTAYPLVGKFDYVTHEHVP